MTILILTTFDNIIYAKDSITDTKDRIKENENKIEFEFVEETDINKLIRDKDIKEEIITDYKNYTREESTTSRGEVNRRTEKEQEYINPKDVKISKNMDLTQRTGLSKEDFKEVIKNLKQDKSKFFYNNADIIYDLCEKYEINEIFFCGLIVAESGWNIASNHRDTHNYISLMYNGKLIKYSSTKEGLEVAAKKLHENYLTPTGKYYNGKTIQGVQKKFCPASTTWDDLVYGTMKCFAAAAKKVK